MSRCILHRKEEYIVVQNGHGSNMYYTIINTSLNTHVHINNSIRLAKILIQRARQDRLDGLNDYKLHRVLILQGKDEDWNNMHKTNIRR